ncbi:MAG: class I SAM-dependent methyltransferase [Micropruina sp.]|uniref:class I SAM-dependent methyltransferase n=1 Tax=Micropruina sp. TaxID=2737536 RepID=UPI0039E32854
MPLRDWTAGAAGAKASELITALNARHPWSHNDHFHSWILANLPERRTTALDVGCGRGELLAALAPRFDAVTGTDTDAAMRRQSAVRCAGLPNVVVSKGDLAELGGGFDLITMIAVLHHLDVPSALRQVRRLLAPGGRLLVVGLAPPRTVPDYAWELASLVTNPLIGYVKHPWPSPDGVQPPPFPVRNPTLSFDELRALLDAEMPGATIRHRLGFRHTIAWTKPA